MEKRKINEIKVEKDGSMTVLLKPEEPEFIEVRVLIGGKELKNVKKITFDKNSADKVRQHLNKIV